MDYTQPLHGIILSTKPNELKIVWPNKDSNQKKISLTPKDNHATYFDFRTLLHIGSSILRSSFLIENYGKELDDIKEAMHSFDGNTWGQINKPPNYRKYVGSLLKFIQNWSQNSDTFPRPLSYEQAMDKGYSEVYKNVTSAFGRPVQGKNNGIVGRFKAHTRQESVAS